MNQLSENISIRMVNKAEAAEWVNFLHSTRLGIGLVILLGGDRWICVDKAVLASVDNKTVGIATIASEGEMMNGEPTIVAIYVLPENRKNGVGYRLLEGAVDQILTEDAGPIRLDVLNSKMLKTIARLPAEKRQKLNVIDISMNGTMDETLEK
ncbi:MAG: GNAT family N-acetyltransferase [Patescibacteria group bacterium]